MGGGGGEWCYSMVEGITTDPDARAQVTLPLLVAMLWPCQCSGTVQC